MKLSIVLVCFIVAVALVSAIPLPEHIAYRARGGQLYREAQQHHASIYFNTTVNIFQQLVDHANPKRGTFEQRYWIDTTYWNPTVGPIFLYISGEGPASGSPRGFITEVASNASALLVTLEHRYYGKSLPAPLTDKQTLRTLNVDNVMADLGDFMTHIEATLVGGNKARWVSVGGSYAGALSAWLKVTYKDRLVAAWSSSGVVHAQFDFTAFDAHIGSVIPPTCLAQLRTLMSNFSTMYDDDSQRSNLLTMFGTPSYFTKTDMAWMLADGTSMAVQYGNKAQLCTALADPKAPMEAVAAMFQRLFGADFGAGCYYSTVCLSNSSMSEQWDQVYPWVWQTCSELGYWQVAYPNSIRSQLITSEYYINQCRAAFFPDTLPDTFAFNQKYGGFTPNATHVIALQGSDDPWMPVGVTESLGPLYPEYTAHCDTCGHCGDLGAASASDPTDLTKQREFIRATLLGWLSK
eukprot:PhM_4_TR18501/c0_g1_i1/m.56639